MAVRGRDPINVHVGNRLRLVRRSHGLTQKQLAMVIGVSFQQLQKYERGLNRVGPGALYRLACFLNVPVAFFFEDLPDEALSTLPAKPLDRAPDSLDDQAPLGSGGGALVDAAVLALRTDRSARRLLAAFSRLDDGQFKLAIANFVQGIAQSAEK